MSRCQNKKSEFNDRAWAGKVDDGGFIYTAANGGSSVAGKTADGGLRSYAGMTYAGLKSMIYAGLTHDDPRVKAAYDYITKHYTLNENPGLGQRGLYYYYQTFAKAMDLYGKPTIVDSSGRRHDWRAELIAALVKRQNANGSWVNPADSFMEGDPNIVTAYGLLALASAPQSREAPDGNKCHLSLSSIPNSQAAFLTRICVRLYTLSQLRLNLSVNPSTLLGPAFGPAGPNHSVSGGTNPCRIPHPSDPKT